MLNICKRLMVVLFIPALLSAEYTEAQKRELGLKVLEESLAKLFSEGMKIKRQYQAMSPELREELLSNLVSTAPRSDFIINADISSDVSNSLSDGSVRAFVSMDGQNTWTSTDEVTLLGSPGYENTWEASISTGGGNTSDWYISGEVDAASVDPSFEGFGNVFVSGSPHNSNGSFPPSQNLYADLVIEPSGDASSNQDITAFKGTHRSVGESLEELFLSITLNGGCCDAGSFFGPWYMYGIGILNPESTESIVYALIYGDGGFGQLSPGIMKLSGDVITGDIGSFEYLSNTTGYQYSTSGDSFQGKLPISILTNDSQFGPWPNEFQGIIGLGVTIQASLNGLDVAADILDQTQPALFVADTQSQTGNQTPQLSNASNDGEVFSIDYIDADGNLPWFHNVSLCNGPVGPDAQCYQSETLLPDSHDYLNGVNFSVAFSEVNDDACYAHFWLTDDQAGSSSDPNNQAIAELEFRECGGGNDCTIGDSNGDGLLNILDVVLLVNIVLLGDDADECSDVNGDGLLNILDVVLLVNLVLTP